MFVQRLRKVQQALLRQSVIPEVCRFNMRYFGVKTDNYILSNALDAKPVCGTMACIAGEAILSAGLAVIPQGGGFNLTKEAFKIAQSFAAYEDRSDEELVARKILGLTDEQAKRLFYFRSMDQGFSWPEKFEEAYRNATTATQRSLIGAQRIELFIQSKGKE